MARDSVGRSLRVSKLPKYESCTALALANPKSPANFRSGAPRCAASWGISLRNRSADLPYAGSPKAHETLNPGFERGHVLLVGVDLRNAHYPEPNRGSIFDEMLERLRALPGVRAASTDRKSTRLN